MPGKKYVLVVDNNAFYTRLIAEHLQGRGYEVAEANSGADAMRRIEARPPDAIILDLIMPEIDGVQVCEYLQSREHLRSIAIIILSGILPEEIENLGRLGARAFVAKMQAEKILAGIDECLERVLRGETEVRLEGFHSMHRREVVRELLEGLRSRDALLESLSEGTAAVGNDGVIVYCNEAFAKLVGRRPWETLNLTIEACFPEHSTRVRHLVNSLDTGGEPRVEIEMGGRILDLRAEALLREGARRGLVLVLEDVSGRRQAERERERLQHQLLQAEKLSALGRLISGVAHELNNPLTGVIGYSQLVLGAATEPKLKRQMERIYSQATRCQKIIQNLIVFGQRHAPIKRHLGLNGILRKVIEVMGLQLKMDGIEVETELDAKLPLTMVDYDQMRQVFMNLINNAHQAMLQAKRRTLVARSARSGDRIRIEFQDSGPGVPPEMLNQLFEPFFTTREVGQGMGLGLSISYSIVREHGGSLRVENVRGGGALVILDLPVVEAPRVQEKTTVPAQRRAGGKTWRVLVVDDEPVVLDLLVDLFVERHYRADTASNGREALHKLSSGSYDAVVLDLKMPEVDGIQVYREMQQRFPALARQVVFATGDSVDEDTRSFLDRVGQPVLGKPFDIDKLVEVIEGLASAAKAPAPELEPATKS